MKNRFNPNATLAFSIAMLAATLSMQAFAEDTPNANPSAHTVETPQADAESKDTANNADTEETSDESTAEESNDIQEVPTLPKAVEVPSPYPPDMAISAILHTSEGDICCDLFHNDHPKTVANFMALSQDNILPWTDQDGKKTRRAFYVNRPFYKREPGAFAACGDPKENQNGSPGFVIPDERCAEHKSVAGALGMAQIYPGTAATQFFILARDIPMFENLYTIFGHCTDAKTIDALTRKDATLQSITIQKKAACTVPAEN